MKSAIQWLRERPLISGLLAANLAVALIWAGVLGHREWDRRAKLEAAHSKDRKVIARITGSDEAEVKKLGEVGTRMRAGGPVADQDLLKLLDHLDSSRPESPSGYQDPRRRTSFILALGRLGDSKNLSPDQQRLMASRVGPIPDMGSSELQSAVNDLVKALAGKLTDPQARTQMEALAQ